jgi:NADH-quinone oxidoreductase subunit L
MPITWITSLLGTLALIGFPGFSGFYSKDSIIEAVGRSHLAGAGFAQFAVTAGVFITAFYSFRMYFLVFHGKERFGAAAHGHKADHAHADAHADAHAHDSQHAGHDDHGHDLQPHESPVVVWLPLVLLAIPSVVLGAFAIGPMLFGDTLAGAITVHSEAHPGMEELAKEFPGALSMALEGFASLPFVLAFAGFASAAWFYLFRPDIPAKIASTFGAITRLLEQKYYLDRFNETVFAGGARWIGANLWRGGDVTLIDGMVVNGSARLVGRFAQLLRRAQTGYLFHYAFVMLAGLALLLFVAITLPHLTQAGR